MVRGSGRKTREVAAHIVGPLSQNHDFYCGRRRIFSPARPVMSPVSCPLNLQEGYYEIRRFTTATITDMDHVLRKDCDGFRRQNVDVGRTLLARSTSA